MPEPYEASVFSWDGDILRAAFPRSRTSPKCSPDAAMFWMKEAEVRWIISCLQGALVKTGRAMQPPLTEEQIAWWTAPIPKGDSNANSI